MSIPGASMSQPTIENLFCYRDNGVFYTHNLLSTNGGPYVCQRCGAVITSAVPIVVDTVSVLRNEVAVLRAERDEAREHARIAADAHRKEGDRAIAAEARTKLLAEALAPFAKFKFGALWYGHEMVKRNGDCIVVCGYTDDGKRTGVDVMQSDFDSAARVLPGGEP